MPSICTILKCGGINAWYKFFLVSNGSIFFILLRTAICWLTFQHILDMWASNFSLSSIVVPMLFYLVLYRNYSSFTIENCFFWLFSYNHSLILFRISFHSVLVIPFINTCQVIIYGIFYLIRSLSHS